MSSQQGAQPGRAGVEKVLVADDPAYGHGPSVQGS